MQSASEHLLGLSSSALNQHFRSCSKCVELIGETLDTERLLQSRRQIALGENPGVSAWVGLKQIKLAGTGFADDVDALQRYFWQRRIRAPRKLKDVGIRSEFSSDRPVATARFESDVRKRLIARVERRSFLFRRGLERKKRSPEERQHTMMI